MKSHKILNFAQKGFSLVEIVVALGLLGIAGLAVMNLSDNINTNTVRAEAMMAKAQFASAMGQHLNSTLGCEEIKDKTFSTNPNSPTNLVVTKWNLRDKKGNLVTELKPGVEFKYFTMKSITASVDNSSSLPVVNINGVPHKKSIVTIKATVTVPMPTNRDYEYFYHIPVLKNNSNKITDCSESKNMRETCVAMRGVYDEGSGTCELEKTCKLKGTYQVLTCSPSGYGCSSQEGSSRVNDQTGSYTCPAGSTRNHTGTKTWDHQVSCGKKCTKDITNTMRWYSCLECPPGSGPTPPPSTSGPGGSSSGCFVAGTRITMAHSGHKNIEDVKAGDELFDSEGNVVRVEQLIAYDYSGLIYSINGGRHFFTPNHPFLTLDGWKSLDPAKSMRESPGLKVSMLQEGDVLMKHGSLETVYVLDAIHSEEKVYNFSVTGSHEYIADDYFVHNIEAPFKE